MSAFIMRRDRSQFASDDPFEGTPEEMQNAFQEFDAYCGTYGVDYEKRVLWHQLDGSKLPGWVGSDQVRLFRFFCGRLIMTSIVPTEGDLQDFKAVLKRL
jgi:hypothetical protein